MDILERLKHFKDYKYIKRNQEEEIRKQEAIVHACDDMCLPDNLKNQLFQDVQEAKGKHPFKGLQIILVLNWNS